MHSYRHKKLLPYAPVDLFKLVLDVESYPKFLPWCTSGVIIEKNGEGIIAELVIGFKGFTQSYKSKITTKIMGDTHIIEVEAISGPFKSLYNYWEIKKVENGSEVDFAIEFSFNSMILNSLIGGLFKAATERMVDAFETRASEILVPLK